MNNICLKKHILTFLKTENILQQKIRLKKANVLQLKK